MKEKTLKSQILYEGKILNVYKDKVELENGKEDIREYVHNDGGVCVLALTENQEIIFVKQFRSPFKEVNSFQEQSNHPPTSLGAPLREVS